MRPANGSQPGAHGDFGRLSTAEDRASLLETLHRVLKIRQSLRGGWGFNAKQNALEPTCLAILTLRHQSGAHVEKALNRIAQLLHQDGSWPAFDGAGGEALGQRLVRFWACSLLGARAGAYSNRMAAEPERPRGGLVLAMEVPYGGYECSIRPGEVQLELDSWDD